MSTLQQLDRESSLSALVEMRTGTDIEIPPKRLLLPLANYLIWALIAVGLWSAGAGFLLGDIMSLFTGLAVVGLAASIGGSYVVFTLVNRCNEHCNRARALFQTASRYLEAQATASGQNALLALNSTEDGLYKLTRAERDRSAVLWALLTLFPLLGWIFLVVGLWRLSRDFARHSQFEDLVLHDLDRTLRTMGLNGVSARPAPITRRDTLGVIVILGVSGEVLSGFVLGLDAALVLIYLTIGALSLFWIDLAIRDPTPHFEYHSRVEAELLKSLPDVSGGAVE